MPNILAKFLHRRTAAPVIQRLKVEPGDVLVAAVPATLGVRGCERLRVGMQANLPGVDVLVISDNVKLSVIAKGAGQNLALHNEYGVGVRGMTFGTME